jgi:hypothetical protein
MTLHASGVGFHAKLDHARAECVMHAWQKHGTHSSGSRFPALSTGITVTRRAVTSLTYAQTLMPLDIWKWTVLGTCAVWMPHRDVYAQTQPMCAGDSLD